MQIFRVLWSQNIPVSSHVVTIRVHASTSTADDTMNNKFNVLISICRCCNSITCFIICKGKNLIVTVLKAAQIQAFIETKICTSTVEQCRIWSSVNKNRK